MSIKMLRDKILVAENKSTSSTASGIIIEGANAGESKTGKVLSVGPKVENIEVGDTVYLNWSKGQIVRIDGEQRVIVAEEDVAAIKN